MSSQPDTTTVINLPTRRPDASGHKPKHDTGMNALEALQYEWGTAYEIEGDGESWRAHRLDGLGGWVEANAPDDLRNQIFADYALKPVRVRTTEAEGNV